MTEHDSARQRSIRKHVFLRDGRQCVYCNTRLSLDGHIGRPAATMDHLIPDSLGGPYEPWNLVLSCMPCNSARNSQCFSQYLDSMPSAQDPLVVAYLRWRYIKAVDRYRQSCIGLEYDTLDLF